MCSVKKRIHDKLYIDRIGRDELFVQTFEDKDLAGNDVVMDEAERKATYDRIVLKWARQDRAIEWLNRPDLYPWEKEIQHVGEYIQHKLNSNLIVCLNL